MTPQTKPANTPPPAAIRMLRPRIDSERSDKDLYLFAFLSGLIAASQSDLQKAI